MATRGRYAKGEAKRQEILDAALTAVAVNGSRRTRVSEIADRVGLTQAGLMHYFRTREELFLAVLRARDERDTVEFVDEHEGIEGFFALMAYNQTVPGLVQLYTEFAAEATHPGHPSHEFFKQRYADIARELVRIIEEAKDAGELRPDVEARSLAELLIAAADGLQVQWLLDRRVDIAGRLRALWDGARIASLPAR